LDDGDHRNHCIEEAISVGSVITRKISRERVERRITFELSIVAIYAPSGLGCAYAEAVFFRFQSALELDNTQ
jgi:hypothetical protein